jgi:uncharacterized membrane protein YqiK
MTPIIAALNTGSLLAVLIPIAVAICFLLGAAALFRHFYRKVPQGQALIINKFKSVEVTFTGGFVWPIVYKAEPMDISVQTITLMRKGKNGLICQDNIRADIEVKFYTRVNKTAEDVLKVAGSVGCDRASDPQKLEELFNAKFSEALKTVGKQMNFEALFTDREQLKAKVIEVIGQDLNGYKLEDVAIDYLEQTPVSELDRSNIQDAQGIRKITELTSVEHIATNESNRSREMQLKKRDVEASQAILELEKQEADARLRQTREIESTRAREEAATKLVQADEQLKAESALIKTAEALAIAEQNKLREIEVASKNRERTIAVEGERVLRDQQLEIVERERVVSLKGIDKEMALETQRKTVEEAKRERIIVEKTAVIEQEKIKDTIAEATSARAKKVTLTHAEEVAQAQIIQETSAARAKEESSKHEASEQVIRAEAELLAASKHADAKKVLAEGTIAETSADGLAKVRVLEANARAIELEGNAKAVAAGAQYKVEAEGTLAKGAADASSIAARADAMEKLSTVGREHEEFKLRLSRDERLETARITAQADIAKANAPVLAKAFEGMKFDFVGGDPKAIETVIRAATMGKTVDKFVDSSEVVRTLTNGGANPEELFSKIKDLVSKAGLTTESIKNLSVSALLNRLAQNKATASDATALVPQIPTNLASMTVEDAIALWMSTGGKF